MSTGYTLKWRHPIPTDAKAEPCPFCGAEQGVIVVLSPYENHGPYWVECGRCNAQGSETNPATLAGVTQAIALWNTRAKTAEGWAEARAAFAVVDDWFRSLGGDDRASDGEQKAEAGNLAPASPVVHPTPPGYPTMALDDPRAKEWAKELGPAIVTAQEARINALEEAAKIVDEKADWVGRQAIDSCPETFLEDVAAEIRAAK